ncbi:hypothetical protein, partial [Klebsiella pneumoniae]
CTHGCTQRKIKIKNTYINQCVYGFYFLSHQEKQISYQQDLPTNMNPSKPALPGFFIKADCSDATTRMIGMYICTYPMRFLICQLRLLKQLFEYAMIIYTQKVIAMIREKTHLDISEKIHGVALL